jgi:putative peptidoglycan lipid II flippase
MGSKVSGKKTVNMVLLVIYLTIFSKIFGLIRDIIIGARFGTGLESDAYFAAYRMSVTLFLSMGTAITAITIPLVVNHLKGDYEGLVNRLMTLFILITGVLVGLGEVFAPLFTSWIAVGFEGEKLALTVTLVRILLPVLMVIPLVYLLISVLQAKERFVITSLVSLPHNLIIVLYLLLFTWAFGIKGLAAASLLGWLGQLAFLGYGVKRQGFKFGLSRHGFQSEIKDYFRGILPVLMASGVYSVNVLVDSAIASTLAEGHLAALNFANIAYTALATTLIFGISAVLFPGFSELALRGEMAALGKGVGDAVKVMVFVFVPVIFGILSINRELVSLIYERGSFDLMSVTLTSGALGFYTLGILGFSFQEIGAKVFYALKDTRTPFIFSGLSVLVNIVLDLILVRFMGIRGLALATSLAVTLNGGILLFLAKGKIGVLGTEGLLIRFIKIVISSGGMAMGVVAFMNWFIGYALWLRLPAGILLGLVIYLIAGRILGIEEIEYIRKEIIGGLKKSPHRS